MKWFKISLVEIFPDNYDGYSNHFIGNRVPSSGGQEFYPVEAFTLYSNSHDLENLNALIGLVDKVDSVFPSDWVQLTLDEAKEVFKQIMGFDPTSEQVY